MAKVTGSTLILIKLLKTEDFQEFLMNLLGNLHSCNSMLISNLEISISVGNICSPPGEKSQPGFRYVCTYMYTSTCISFNSRVLESITSLYSRRTGCTFIVYLSHIEPCQSWPLRKAWRGAKSAPPYSKKLKN